MRIFVAASYSSQVNYKTGEVFPEYKEWLEGNLTLLEGLGHTVFCALRADGYRINNDDPAAAFSLDVAEIEASDALLAFITNKSSEGVQTEIGLAVGKNKQVVIAHSGEHTLGYFDQAMIMSGQVKEQFLPLSTDPFTT